MAAKNPSKSKYYRFYKVKLWAVVSEADRGSWVNLGLEGKDVHINHLNGEAGRRSYVCRLDVLNKKA